LIGYLVEALADLFSEVLRREKLVEEGQESIIHNQRQLDPSCVCVCGVCVCERARWWWW
jgi:hypothetical protein